MPDIDAMVRHWREATDEAVVEAAEQLNDFTDEGRSVVLDELQRRGLTVPPPATNEDRADPSLRIEEVEVWRGSGMIAAEPVLAVLHANDIPARTHGEALGQIYSLTLDGLGEVGILVPADRADEALKLLAAGDDGQLALADDEPRDA